MPILLSNSTACHRNPRLFYVTIPSNRYKQFRTAFRKFAILPKLFMHCPAASEEYSEVCVCRLIELFICRTSKPGFHHREIIRTRWTITHHADPVIGRWHNLNQFSETSKTWLVFAFIVLWASDAVSKIFPSCEHRAILLCACVYNVLPFQFLLAASDLQLIIHFPSTRAISLGAF